MEKPGQSRRRILADRPMPGQDLTHVGFTSKNRHKILLPQTTLFHEVFQHPSRRSLGPWLDLLLKYIAPSAMRPPGESRSVSEFTATLIPKLLCAMPRVKPGGSSNRTKFILKKLSSSRGTLLPCSFLAWQIAELSSLSKAWTDAARRHRSVFS